MKKSVSFLLPEFIPKELKQESKRLDLSQSDIVRYIFDSGLENMKKQESSKIANIVKRHKAQLLLRQIEE